METQAVLGFREHLTHVVNDMADAISRRPGESTGQRSLRKRAAVKSISAFSPRDVPEATFAGRCLMFHELMVDSVRHTLSGEEEATRRSSRATIVAMDRAFGNNLAPLERYKSRVPAAHGAAQPVPPAAPPEAAAEAPPEETVVPTDDPRPAPDSIGVAQPPKGSVQGDPVRFANLTGVDARAEFVIAAKKPGCPLDPPPPADRSAGMSNGNTGEAGSG
jgi:hypothetical protein